MEMSDWSSDVYSSDLQIRLGTIGSGGKRVSYNKNTPSPAIPINSGTSTLYDDQEYWTPPQVSAKFTATVLAMTMPFPLDIKGEQNKCQEFSSHMTK